MKTKLLWFVTILPMIVTAAVIRFLPDEVPLHYDFAGNIDRWGTKYEKFLFPVVIIIMTIFWCLFLRYFQKKQQTATEEKKKAEARSNEKVIYWVAVGMAVMFGIMHYFSMYSAWVEVKGNMTMSAIDINIVTNVLLGIFLIVIGNIMPKTRRNSALGLRTTWSLYNDKTWSASNRFGGLALMIAGFVSIIVTLLLGGIVSTFIMLGLIVLAAVVATVYSYKVYKTQQ